MDSNGRWDKGDINQNNNCIINQLKGLYEKKKDYVCDDIGRFFFLSGDE